MHFTGTVWKPVQVTGWTEISERVLLQGVQNPMSRWPETLAGLQDSCSVRSPAMAHWPIDLDVFFYLMEMFVELMAWDGELWAPRRELSLVIFHILRRKRVFAAFEYNQSKWQYMFYNRLPAIILKWILTLSLVSLPGKFWCYWYPWISCTVLKWVMFSETLSAPWNRCN